MKVKDIMTKDVACVGSEDTIEQAAQLMKQYHVGSIPVCRQKQVVGIVTDRDITLRATARKQGSDRKVSEVMSSNPVLGNPEMDVREAAKIMSEQQIRRLPVVEQNQLVGIVALGDISVSQDSQGSAGQALNGISQPGGQG
ncbi:CBS domain-containing protein [Caproiciproducens sp. NJN-50]|uniref:CBS domain-containing protein n=1 Tax=Acutalibacteraceae TaxID=3082771 RepID=UPI000FFE2CE9|nr:MULTISPECIES: CBS domain-containing protein [Acutalibacteraceae]QAT51071.1 CBS domain-containing protein [Caproiciproducens sp. NJN-50]